MKAYGYATGDEELTSLELSEVALLVTLDEIQDLIGFLKKAYEEHSQIKIKGDYDHSHLKDWKSNYKDKEHTDLIIVTK
ncbi:MAG: hypothetical protein JO154_22500 [Chitinophaga sp.]|uniref:hypothetical protein n=1 Tax=Chitinophaga sp. TaxID=1869181 RepID=UPI0025BCE107|nr:hypothetical protein [Chitinophaga sp.]MBV8255389.1 hypothetical protein [Chitinophaga sp.]